MDRTHSPFIPHHHNDNGSKYSLLHARQGCLASQDDDGFTYKIKIQDVEIPKSMLTPDHALRPTRRAMIIKAEKEAQEALENKAKTAAATVAPEVVETPPEEVNVPTEGHPHDSAMIAAKKWYFRPS